MPRDLKTALTSVPLLFESVPPTARTSSGRAAQIVEEASKLISGVGRIDALDIPELVDENHEGRPYYRSGDPREFAHALGQRTRRETIVNKVVAHLSSEALEHWIRETVARGIRHVILVGGSSRYIPYPGPTVAEANRICRHTVEQAGGLIGNIAIPQRTGEAHRLLAKTRAGASFFTTQILFDSESVLRLLREYDGLCRQAGAPAAPLILSMAPLADEADAEFARWLGADITEAAERLILEGEEGEAVQRSIENALRVWEEVREEMHRQAIEVPIGVNVEQISSRHLNSAGDLIRSFSNLLPAP